MKNVAIYKFMYFYCSLNIKIQTESTVTAKLKLGFPTGRDSATFRDNGTEVLSLSRDKGTTGQAQNLATGRAGILTGCPSHPRKKP